MASTSTLCFICKTETSRYTCPRDKIKTCSVTCTRQHKTASNCSGQRDKAAFIKPNEYGYGQLMDDYTFLEEVGRFVADKGRMLQDDKVKGKGKAPARQVPEWVRQATQAGIEVVLLREGMERRMQNQSKYVKGTKTLHFTITFALKLPLVTTDLITHNNATTSSLFDLMKKPLSDGRAAKIMSSAQLAAFRSLYDTPDGLVFLLPVLSNPLEGYAYEPPKAATPEPEPLPHTPQNHPSLPARPDFVFGLPPVPVQRQPQQQKMTTGLIKRPLTAFVAPEEYAIEPTAKRIKPSQSSQVAATNQTRAKKQEERVPKYRMVDPTQGLIQELKGSRIIEWPVVEIWSSQEYRAKVVAGQIHVEQTGHEQVEVKEVKSALVDYGSEDEDEDQVVAGLLVA